MYHKVHVETMKKDPTKPTLDVKITDRQSAEYLVALLQRQLRSKSDETITHAGINFRCHGTVNSPVTV